MEEVSGYSQECFELTQSIAQIGSWELDFEKDTINWSKEIFRIFEIEKKRYSSTREAFLKIVYPADLEKVCQIYSEFLTHRKPYEVEYRLLMSDGRIKFVKENCILVFGADDIPLRSIGTVRDITEHNRTERMKNGFISTINHELRTPLSSINASLEFVTSGVLDNSPELTKQMLDIALKSAHRLTELVNNLLDIRKLEIDTISFDMHVHNIIPLVEQALNAAGQFAEKYDVHYNLAERVDVQVNVDQLRIKQVLVNLLSNAAKFSSSGDEVKIVIKRFDKVVRVEVINSGPAIPVEFRNCIFQKFTQADSSNIRQKDGAGLGLAISKEIIERMHGVIDFNSEPAQTCFYFDLPVWYELQAKVD